MRQYLLSSSRNFISATRERDDRFDCVELCFFHTLTRSRRRVLVRLDHLCRKTPSLETNVFAFASFSGDILVFFNKKNLFQPPNVSNLDRIRSEFTVLRRQHQIIHVGICRYSNRSSLNSATWKHISSLAWTQFETLSQHDHDHSQPSVVATGETKKRLSLFSSKKKPTSTPKRYSSSNRDSGFVETDGRPKSLSRSRMLIRSQIKVVIRLNLGVKSRRTKVSKTIPWPLRNPWTRCSSRQANPFSPPSIKSRVHRSPRRRSGNPRVASHAHTHGRMRTI